MDRPPLRRRGVARRRARLHRHQRARGVAAPRSSHCATPARDTVLYPAVAYPTYEMGARLAGLRAVPVPLDERWHLDLSRISEADADRALVIWVNEPGNPTGASGGRQHLRAVVDWARECGAIVASDECYAEFTYDESGSPAAPVTVLSAGHDRVLAVHSLSKRSNMAGLRAGFLAGDAALVSYLGEVRKHAGLMTPAPVQAAATAALGDDAHVDEQRDALRPAADAGAGGAPGVGPRPRRRPVDVLPVAARDRGRRGRVVDHAPPRRAGAAGRAGRPLRSRRFGARPPLAHADRRPPRARVRTPGGRRSGV